MRVAQPRGKKGSLKWIQRAVNLRPALLQPDGWAPIRWLSPLEADGFAEYRDGAFLDRLGLGHLKPRLAAFWPARGPQWDALGTSGERVVLVEAKAHVAEFFSPASAAGDASRARILAAFAEVQENLGLAANPIWLTRYYQYANRLAHLWFLRRHGIDARLVFVGFLGDGEVAGPRTPAEWRVAFAGADYALGLPARHRLAEFIVHVHPDVAQLAS